MPNKTPQLLIISSQNDISAKRLVEEGSKLITTDHFLYDELLRRSLPIPNIQSGKNVILLARQPYVANQIEHSFDALLYILLNEFEFKRVFDSQLYQQSFMRYEDKLYQSFIFQKHNLPFAPLWDTNHPTQLKFPLIAKKRISSRHNANYVLNNLVEYESFIKNHDISQYILQSFFPLRADYRILICKNKLLGVVARETWIENHKTAVKVREVAQLPEEITNQAISLSKLIGCDLCGIDVGEKENGEFFFIEYNPSPQFLGFERETGRNIAGEIIHLLLD